MYGAFCTPAIINVFKQKDKSHTVQNEGRCHCFTGGSGRHLNWMARLEKTQAERTKTPPKGSFLQYSVEFLLLFQWRSSTSH